MNKQLFSMASVVNEEINENDVLVKESSKRTGIHKTSQNEMVWNLKPLENTCTPVLLKHLKE